MLKRAVILAVLSSILIALFIIKSHTVSPVNNTNAENNGSVKYITQEYKINKIKGNQYYGESDDGTGIQFSAVKIGSGNKIEVNDTVLCYFEKDNLGKGIIKVEKK